MDKGSPSQMPELSTHHNQSANNVPSESPITFDSFASDQDNLHPIFPSPMTPVNIFRDIVNPLVEEANAPSQYNYLSEEAIGLDLYDMSYHEDFYLPCFEPSYVYPPLSSLNTFSDTSDIVLSPPLQPLPLPPAPEPPADDQAALQQNLEPELLPLPPAPAPEPLVDDEPLLQENPELPTGPVQLGDDQFDNNIDAILPPPILPPTTENVVNLELPTGSIQLDDDQFDNNIDAMLPPPILPPATENVVVSPSSSTMVDDTCTRDIATTSTVDEPNTRSLIAPYLSLSDDQHASIDNSCSSTPTMVDIVTITNEKQYIESSIEIQRRPRKIRRVISNGDVVQSLQSNASHLNFIPEEAIAAQMDVIKLLFGKGQKKKILKPLIVRLDRNEDVAEKIKKFAKEKGPDISIIGAVGTLSVIQLLHQGETTTFEGNFHILSLYATSLPPKGDQEGIVQLSIEVADDNGHVFRGPVQGKLVAKTFIQLSGITISPRGIKLRCSKRKPKLPKYQLRTTSMDQDEKHQSEDAKIDEILADMTKKMQLRPQSSRDDVSMDNVMQDQMH